MGTWSKNFRPFVQASSFSLVKYKIFFFQAQAAESINGIVTLCSCKNLPFNFIINLVRAWLLVAVIRVLECSVQMYLLRQVPFFFLVGSCLKSWGLTQTCVSFFRHVYGASIGIQEFHCGSINEVSCQTFSIQGASSVLRSFLVQLQVFSGLGFQVGEVV